MSSVSRVFAVVLFLVLSTCAGADIINVPGDHATIQAAIDASTNGDEIIVAADTYVENIDFDGKNIILRSTDPTNAFVVAATIIDGASSDIVVTFAGTETAECVLSGFTIRNGHNVVSGGIYGAGTSATIQHNVITENYAENSPLITDPGCGGGIRNCDGLIQNNTIFGNVAYIGGGLSDCDGVIRNNVIEDNWADGGGGLAYCQGTIENNVVRNNSAFLGGGVYNCDGTIRNNMICNNVANEGAGSPYAFLPGRGGGLRMCDGDIYNNVVYGNSATGGLCSGGGFSECTGNIYNNTVYGNAADGTNSSGGGFKDCTGDNIKNCIIWGNTATAGPQIYNPGMPSYCCIEGWGGGGTGNTDSDPQLKDPDNGDLHLTYDSPCVDAGGAVAGLTDDYEGDTRPYNGTAESRGDGSDIDIGADEYVPDVNSAGNWSHYE